MRRAAISALLVLVSACDGPHVLLDAGIDAGQSRMDAGPPDAGRDADPPWSGPGCNSDFGIECDGDWADRCSPACSADECCSPTGGRFGCVARGEDGSCPAANIWVDSSRIDGAYAIEWRHFDEGDCALVEGCVVQPGWRRLLRFGTWTPNTGNADLYLGRPSDAPPFVYSDCHMHYHFNGYAQYELRQSDGTVAAEGHKQAFCLLDFYHYPGTDDTGWHYTCENQGIQAGWQDVYDADLDCQWVDVTDVAPGDYTLHIALNVDHALLESSYDDNTADVTVSIPADAPPDITAACTFARYGADRECGWTRDVATYTCNAGETVVVGCSSACGHGSCEGDTVMRVCPADTHCASHDVIVWGDDSGCSRDDTCSQVTFTCPGDAGTTFSYAVYWAAYYDGEAASCTVGASTTPPATP